MKTYRLLPWLALLAVAGCAAPDTPAGRDAPPAVADTAPSPALLAAVNGPQRSVANRARDAARHPAETLAFFGVAPQAQVLELAPGGGWYTEILAPYLHDQGRLYAAHYARDDARDEYRRNRAGFDAKLAADPAQYGRVVVGTLPGSAFTDLRFDRPLDAVLTFRNLHNWLADGTLDAKLRLFHDVLRPGGVLGVEEHRATPGTPVERQITSGYLTEALVIERARAAGFELAGRSEVNANPRDPHDHPQGVWSLPPTLRDAPAGSPARERALAIGESDRMTLRFVRR
jgi:predicted methyltransferase